MNELDRFEKWCASSSWPDETLQFHLSMWMQTFPARVPKLLFYLVAKARGGDQGEWSDGVKGKSYGFGDPSQQTAEGPGKPAGPKERN